MKMPLFPGYIFCRQTENQVGLMVTTPGVLRIVSFGGTPGIVKDEEIRAIQQLMMSGHNYGPHAYLRVGRQISIVAGPLKGLSGILVKVKKQYRVIVSVDLLMRSAFVEVNCSDIGLL
jgi:transcription antitermination factor NusG